MKTRYHVCSLSLIGILALAGCAEEGQPSEITLSGTGTGGGQSHQGLPNQAIQTKPSPSGQVQGKSGAPAPIIEQPLNQAGHEPSVATAEDAAPKGQELVSDAPAGNVDKSGDNVWGGIFPGEPDRSPKADKMNPGGGGDKNPNAEQAGAANGQGSTQGQGHLPEIAKELRAEIDRGIKLIHGDKLDEADVLFTAVIKDNPDLFEAYDHRSMIYYNRQDYKRVAEDCTKAIDIARATGTFAQTCPDRCLMRRGASYLNLEMWPEALVDFSEVLEYRANDGFAYFERGRSLFGLERFDEAKKDFERSLELDDKHPVSSELSVYYLNKIANPDFH